MSLEDSMPDRGEVVLVSGLGRGWVKGISPDPTPDHHLYPVSTGRVCAGSVVGLGWVLD